MAVVIEHLPSKCKALSSNPTTTKREEEIKFPDNKKLKEFVTSSLALKEILKGVLGI
jgi:hypothetical protein